MSEARIAAGLMNLPALAESAGLPAGGWQATLLSSCQDAKGDRTVVRLDRPDMAPLIVKQAHRDAEAPGMAAGLAAQDRAMRRLQAHPLARVPRLLAFLPDRCAALIEAVPGAPLADAVPLEGALSLAGKWLDAFHRIETLTRAPFRPQTAARGAIRVGAEVEAGQRAVLEPNLFLSHLGALRASAVALRDAEATIAPRHGDLNGRNILIGERFVWGIDFGRERLGANTFDIARLMIFLAARTPDPTQEGVGARLCDLQAAFFQGYKVTGTDDQTLPFTLRAGLLANWATLPPDPTAMSPMQARRFRRILALVSELAPEV